MLDSDEIINMRFNNKKIVIKVNKKYGTVKVGETFFPSLEDFNVFVNKLTDIAEEMSEVKDEF